MNGEGRKDSAFVEALRWLLPGVVTKRPGMPERPLVLTKRPGVVTNGRCIPSPCCSRVCCLAHIANSMSRKIIK